MQMAILYILFKEQVLTEMLLMMYQILAKQLQQHQLCLKTVLIHRQKLVFKLPQLTNGETYAIVVTNLALAQAFVKTFPADQLPNQSPEFHDTIFNQILDVRPQMGESTEGRTRGIAFVLDNNNAGITLMKQDDSGVFNPIKIEEQINADNSKTYNSIPCQ